jgi:hypothetical protein
MTKQSPISQTEIDALRQMLADAGATGTSAVSFSVKRVKLCAAVGERLTKWKYIVGHGHFKRLLAESIPDFSYRTAVRWMKLNNAISSGLDISQARGLRQAYILAGILPQGGPGKPQGKPARQAESHVTLIGKLTESLSVVFPHRLSSGERSVLRDLLKPIATFYNRL